MFFCWYMFLQLKSLFQSTFYMEAGWTAKAAENNSINQTPIKVFLEGILCESIWTTKAELTFLKEGEHKFLPILALHIWYFCLYEKGLLAQAKWLIKLIPWSSNLGNISGPLFSKKKSLSICKYSLNANGCPGWAWAEKYPFSHCCRCRRPLPPPLLLLLLFYFKTFCWLLPSFRTPSPNPPPLMTAPASLLAALLSMGDGVGDEEAREEKEMRSDSLLSLRVLPMVLSSHLGEAPFLLSFWRFKWSLPKSLNPNLALTQQLTPFPALPIGGTPQSQILAELGIREQVEKRWVPTEWPRLQDGEAFSGVPR